MLSKSKIKFVRSLQLRKYRQKYHKIVVEGSKIVTDILSENLLTVDCVIALPEWLAEHADLLHTNGLECIDADERGLRAISGFTTPQPVVAVCDANLKRKQPAHPSTAVGLYLDGIRDPGNVGTIFRIADWFGVENIFLSKDCADPWNPKVIQASMSSVFRLSWSEISAAKLYDQAPYASFFAVLDGAPLSEIAPPTSGLIVLGNESHGISDELLGLPGQRLSIPASWTMGAESLNVGVAAGILCAFVRKVW